MAKLDCRIKLLYTQSAAKDTYLYSVSRMPVNGHVSGVVINGILPRFVRTILLTPGNLFVFAVLVRRSASYSFKMFACVKERLEPPSVRQGHTCFGNVNVEAVAIACASLLMKLAKDGFHVISYGFPKAERAWMRNNLKATSNRTILFEIKEIVRECGREGDGIKGLRNGMRNLHFIFDPKIQSMLLQITVSVMLDRNRLVAPGIYGYIAIRLTSTACLEHGIVVVLMNVFSTLRAIYVIVSSVTPITNINFLWFYVAHIVDVDLFMTNFTLSIRFTEALVAKVYVVNVLNIAIRHERSTVFAP